MLYLINIWLNKMNGDLNIFLYVLEFDFSFRFMSLRCVTSFVFEIGNFILVDAY